MEVLIGAIDGIFVGAPLSNAVRARVKPNAESLDHEPV
jgi:hypothetical protein